VALLMEDYDFFVKDTTFFCERLGALTAARGRELVQNWQDLARNNQCEKVVQELLTLHYDPVYLQSMQRNFQGYVNATQVTLTHRSPQMISAVAQRLTTQKLD
jgi:tRNA 2-selenouridine synthase